MGTIETKVGASTSAAGLAAVLVTVLGGFDITIDPAVAVAITTILVAAVGYLAPHTSRPDLGDPPRGRHHGDGGYSALELLVGVLVVILLVFAILALAPGRGFC